MGTGGADVWSREYQFAIECKNQEVFRPMFETWGQAKYNAEKLGKSPMVIIKMNGMNPLVILDAEEYFFG